MAAAAIVTCRRTARNVTRAEAAPTAERRVSTGGVNRQGIHPLVLLLPIVAAGAVVAAAPRFRGTAGGLGGG